MSLNCNLAYSQSLSTLCIFIDRLICIVKKRVYACQGRMLCTSIVRSFVLMKGNVIVYYLCFVLNILDDTAHIEVFNSFKHQFIAILFFVKVKYTIQNIVLKFNGELWKGYNVHLSFVSNFVWGYLTKAVILHRNVLDRTKRSSRGMTWWIRYQQFSSSSSSYKEAASAIMTTSKDKISLLSTQVMTIISPMHG